MFTGIIETSGTLSEIVKEDGLARLAVTSSLSAQLRPGQSVAHNGVCLTVTETDKNRHWATAVGETLSKSTIGLFKVGDVVNLERCMPADGRFDGHIVQGHVDQVGVCVAVRKEEGNLGADFSYDSASGHITVEKGSIAIDGISLTCFASRPGRFTVAIVPYTVAHTNLRALKAGTRVNLEFDIIGKYIQRLSRQTGGGVHDVSAG